MNEHQNDMLTGTVYTSSDAITVSNTGLPAYIRLDAASGRVTNPYESVAEFVAAMTQYHVTAEPVHHTDVLEQIDKIVSKLENTENDLQLNAVRHLKYAKAYLDKMALDVINERI